MSVNVCRVWANRILSFPLIVTSISSTHSPVKVTWKARQDMVLMRIALTVLEKCPCLVPTCCCVPVGAKAPALLFHLQRETVPAERPATLLFPRGKLAPARLVLRWPASAAPVEPIRETTPETTSRTPAAFVTPYKGSGLRRRFVVHVRVRDDWSDAMNRMVAGAVTAIRAANREQWPPLCVAAAGAVATICNEPGYPHDRKHREFAAFAVAHFVSYGTLFHNGAIAVQTSDANILWNTCQRGLWHWRGCSLSPPSGGSSVRAALPRRQPMWPVHGTPMQEIPRTPPHLWCLQARLETMISSVPAKRAKVMLCWWRFRGHHRRASRQSIRTMTASS
ncbi:hypothetical protein BC832DRAFT_567454 [Gaertneriomyces semiglobifer]|nr:hypothetical protein BC832DRAFT_567454 [Gaertneriomyces semiglobifer]